MTPKINERTLPAPVAVQRKAEMKRVTVWLNAFIHKRVKRRDGSDLSFALAHGPDRGKYVIPGPLPHFPDCYLTDNRGFSADIAASARIHAEITIDFSTGIPKATTFKRCSPSKRFRRSDGALLNADVGTVKGDLIPDPATMIRGSKLVVVNVLLAARNPVARGPRIVPVPMPIPLPALFPTPIPILIPSKSDVRPPPGLDPDIDIDGQVLIDVAAGTVEFSGKVDRFPFFEMYASCDACPSSLEIFRIEPAPGDTPTALFGEANRDVAKVLGRPARACF